jgi:HK97 family phage major capsid protein
MNALQKALARLQKLLGELNALEAKETLTAEDLTAIAAKQTEIEACEAEIATLQKSEQMRSRAAKPANQRAEGGQAEDGEVITEPARPQREMKPEQKASLLAAATLKSRGTNIPVLKILEDEGYAQLAAILKRDAPNPSVTTTVATALIPTVISSEFIELLRPRTTFFQGNPKRVKFTNGKFVAPRGASGATAGYVGEGDKKPVTGPTFDAMTMIPKKLAGIVLITQEARKWSLPDIDAYIRTDLRNAMAQAIDLNAYFGTGATDTPTGILVGKTTFSSADYTAAPLAPSITEIDTMASRMVLSLTLANIDQSESWAWLMNYRTLEFLKNLRVGDDTGVYAYPELRLPVPTWKGFRVFVTNQVPINGGATTDESKLALIDFDHVFYAEEEGLTVKTSDQATIDVNGTLVHLWQQNMDAILMESQHDFALRHGAAVALMDHLRWGAGAVGSP